MEVIYTNYKYRIGDQVYFIESNYKISEGLVINRTGEFYVVRYKNGDGGLRLRETRLFSSREEAENKFSKSEIRTRFRSPYDYGA